jgi:hypothetical protein
LDIITLLLFYLIYTTPTFPIHNIVDVPPSSLMDSIASPKVKTIEGEGVGHVPWLVAFRG